MTIKTLIRNLFEHFSVLGPSSPGAIPADARPIHESEDPTPVDDEPETVPASSTTNRDVETTVPHDADEGSDESTVDEPQGSAEPQDADGTSTQPSPATSTEHGASEAAEGASDAIVSAVEAAIEALVSMPEAAAPTKRTFKFEPTITKEMMAEYEKSVESGDTAAALSKLLGKAVAEAFEVYDEAVVLPVLTKIQADKRESDNAKRVSQWSVRNPKRAADTALWTAMGEVYQSYATKYGASRADRISVDHIAILAEARLGRTRKSGSQPATKAKAQALAAQRVPGSIGTTRPGRSAAKAVPYAGNDYRQYLKATNRDPF